MTDTPETTMRPEVAKMARRLWDALPRVPEIEDVAALLEEHVLPAHEAMVRAKVAEEIDADMARGNRIAPYGRCIRVALGEDPDAWTACEIESGEQP